MRRRNQLTDRQRVILQRVADRDDFVDAAPGDKRSANALGDRGLVVVRRSPWRATVTEAGRYYLKHGQYPDTQKPPADSSGRQAAHEAPVTSTTNIAASRPASTMPVSTSAKRPPPHTTARISAARRAAAVQLVDELVAAGEKVIEEPDDAARAEWRKVIDFAKRNGLVPAGQRIEKMTDGIGDLYIRLFDGPHANSRHDVALPVVPVPTELHGLHPVVKAIQNDSGRLHMCGSLRRRCLLYLHGLTQEAVRRGYTVQEQPIADRHRGRITTYGRPGVPDYSRREGELRIVVNGFSYRITIDQEHSEAADDERYDQLFVWVRGPGQRHGCRTRWHDRKRSTVEDSIASVLGEIERWAAEARRLHDDRQARWQAAMDEAKRLAIHDRLVAELEQQVQSWRTIQQLRQYCDSLEARILDADDDEPVDEAKCWLQWAREHAEIMDPLFQLPVMPAPKLRPQDLEPYLDGWSPQGPEVFAPRWRGASYML